MVINAIIYCIPNLKNKKELIRDFCQIQSVFNRFFFKSVLILKISWIVKSTTPGKLQVNVSN